MKRIIPRVQACLLEFSYFSTKIELGARLIRFFSADCSGSDQSRLDVLNAWFHGEISREPQSLARSASLRDAISCFIHSGIPRLRDHGLSLVPEISIASHRLKVLIDAITELDSLEIETVFKQEIEKRVIQLRDAYRFINTSRLDQLQFDLVKKVCMITQVHGFSGVIDILSTLARNITTSYYREEAIKEIHVAFQPIVTRTADEGLKSKLTALLGEIHDPATLSGISVARALHYKQSKNDGEISSILGNLKCMVHEQEGEFSRALMIRNYLKILFILRGENTWKSEEAKDIIEFSRDHQGLLSHCQVLLEFMQLVKIYGTDRELNSIIRQVIEIARHLSDGHFFKSIVKRLLDILKDSVETIEGGTFDIMVDVINQRRDSSLKAILLSRMGRNFLERKTCVRAISTEIMALNAPVILDNMIISEHVMDINHFLIDVKIHSMESIHASDVRGIIEDTPGISRQCHLLVHAARGFLLKGEMIESEKCLSRALTLIQEVNNEFEKKEILVRIIDVLEESTALSG
ncbi:hypothetical protein GF325_07110 [Candidatus Bathyarchaeota archaeon]|nr:hypothetical protein [Candidatus Bathyarchaeota archaeon]